MAKRKGLDQQRRKRVHREQEMKGGKRRRETAESKNQEDRALGDSDEESHIQTEFPHTDKQPDGRNKTPQKTLTAELVTRHPHRPPNAGGAGRREGGRPHQPQACSTATATSPLPPQPHGGSRGPGPSGSRGNWEAAGPASLGATASSERRGWSGSHELLKLSPGLPAHIGLHDKENGGKTEQE